MIFDAVEKAGVRVLVSKGWGGMGDRMGIPDGVCVLDNTPHDWLSPRVDAAIHYGGAGTTAIGLKWQANHDCTLLRRSAILEHDDC
jgi:UDP:flavonoid glycosyltransferase YjiC (YdhE family)